MSGIGPGATVTGDSGAEYEVGDLIGTFGDDSPCDADEWGGNATRSIVTGKCRCVVCARCDHHTGNSHQGHYWRSCKVTGTMREFHMCCPDPVYGCELEATDEQVGEY